MYDKNNKKEHDYVGIHINDVLKTENIHNPFGVIINAFPPG